MSDMDRNSYSPTSIKREVKSDINQECKPDMCVKFESNLAQVKSPTFTYIIDDWASFASFPDASRGSSQPTTIWDDVRSLQSCPQSDRLISSVKHTDVLHTVPVDRSIPRHQPLSSPGDHLVAPTKSKNRKAKHICGRTDSPRAKYTPSR